MFERCTDKARRVIVLAQEEARQLKHNYIGTEHLLLGLVHEGDGLAAQALAKLGVSREAVRSQVEEIVGEGQQALSGHIPFTPRAKKVLELSLREALQLGHNYIGTEHLLLALTSQREGIGAEVFTQLGVELAEARKEVFQLVAGYQPAEAVKPMWEQRRMSLFTDYEPKPDYAQVVFVTEDNITELARELAKSGHDAAIQIPNLEQARPSTLTVTHRESVVEVHAGQALVCNRDGMKALDPWEFRKAWRKVPSE